MTLQIRCRLRRPGRETAAPGFTLDVDLDLPDAGVTTLWGPSGSGKTTLLRCVAGLEPQAAGLIRLGGETWLDTSGGVDLPPHRRPVGYVFQDGMLFPHLDVRGNLLFGWRRTPHGRRGLELAEAARLLGLESLLDRDPRGLSGGEQRRVALGRALLAGPRLLLLDEPLAGVDAGAREAVYPYLENLAGRFAVPILHVTHSVSEAARLADHAVLLEDGRCLGSGPAGRMLTDLGLDWTRTEEATAVLPARVTGRDEPYHLNRLQSSAGTLGLPGPPLVPGQWVRVKVAARDVILALQPPTGTSVLNVLPATVIGLGDHEEGRVLVRLQVGQDYLLAQVTRRSAADLDLIPGRKLFALIKSIALVG